MSPQGVDIPKTASVLGYCMLPLVMLSSLSTLFVLKYVSHYHTSKRVYLVDSVYHQLTTNHTLWLYLKT